LWYSQRGARNKKNLFKKKEEAVETDKQNNVGATKGHAAIDHNRLKGEELLEGFCSREILFH
jgi:hypothetical protein